MRFAMLAMLVLVGGRLTAASSAKALSYTNDCEDQMTIADRALLEAAFDLVDEYEDDVEEHINDARAGGNPFSYTAIDAALMDDWRERVALMREGDIKVACRYNATYPRCGDGFGETFTVDALVWAYDRVGVCIDNIRSGRSLNEQVALAAGTLAHELMHHVDGLARAHGADGLTDVQSPDTPSETIGVAMEHLVLTPDLRATITRLTATVANGAYDLVIEVDLDNLNPNAGDGEQAVSTETPNVESTLSVAVDGGTVCTLSVPRLVPLDGGTPLRCSMSVPAYEPGAAAARTITVTADAGDGMFEYDEWNNTDTVVLDTGTDLAIHSVEVTAPPSCHHTSIGPAGRRVSALHWFEVPYRVTVTNLDADATSPPVDLAMVHDEAFASTPRVARQTIDLPALAPKQVHSELFTLTVPTDSACSGPGATATDVSFVVDRNADSVFDPDRSNNAVSFAVNADYWRPDYVLRNLALRHNDVYGMRTLAYAIRNVGPARAGTGQELMSSATKVTWDDTTVFSGRTFDLDPGEEQTYETPIALSACETRGFTVSADVEDDIEEYVETNNVAWFTVQPMYTGTRSSARTAGGGGGVVDCDEDLPPIEGAEDVLDYKLSDLNYVQWGTDRAGVESGNHLVILDELGPSP